MNKYHLFLLWCVFLWTIIIFDQRNYFCKRATLWSFVISAFGVMLVSISVFMNCDIAYSEGLTNLRYDTKVVLDTLFLKINKYPEYLFMWRTAIFGNSFIISGVAVSIICRMLKRGIIPGKKVSDNLKNK